jgi:hypothetical protein
VDEVMPNCPGCGQEPMLRLGHQSWCDNALCDTIAWNPHEGADQRVTIIELPGARDGTTER